jgi:hypothetical protein
MGFNNKTTSTSISSIRYSAFLGALYMMEDKTSEELKKAYALVGGEGVVKKGFTGSSGASATALKALKEAGQKFGNMEGLLTGVRLNTRDVGGRPTPYLGLTLTDGTEKFHLSVSIPGQKGVQMLIRKLAMAQIKEPTVVSLFAKYEKKEGADRAYGDHVASLKQNGSEVKGVNPQDELTALVEAALVSLKAAGVDDAETISKRRAKVELDFHLALLGQIEQKINAFYGGAQAPAEEAPEAEASSSIPEAELSGYADEYPDNIAF